MAIAGPECVESVLGVIEGGIGRGCVELGEAISVVVVGVAFGCCGCCALGVRYLGEAA